MAVPVLRVPEDREGGNGKNVKGNVIIKGAESANLNIEPDDGSVIS